MNGKSSAAQACEGSVDERLMLAKQLVASRPPTEIRATTVRRESIPDLRKWMLRIGVGAIP